MPSHRDALNKELEVLRSCSVLAKNCPLACRSSLAHSSSQELFALSIWLTPVLGSSQALKVPRLSGRKRRECLTRLSAFGGDGPPGAGPHMTRFQRIVSIIWQWAVEPNWPRRYPVLQHGYLVYSAKEGLCFMDRTAHSYAVTPRRRIGSPPPRGKSAARSGSRRNALIRASATLFTVHPSNREQSQFE